MKYFSIIKLSLIVYENEIKIVFCLSYCVIVLATVSKINWFNLCYLSFSFLMADPLYLSFYLKLVKDNYIY